ncbi:MAG: hypothetical protein ACYSU0_03205 [Planctomycetota bacterium]|jgi:hypothetical protein
MVREAMGRRAVVPGLLICAAISMTGCWVERDAYGKVRIYGQGEFEARERYLKETEPEEFARMEKRKEIGTTLMVIGGIGPVCGFAYIMSAAIGAPWDVTEEQERWMAGAAVGGAVVALIGWRIESTYKPYVRREGRRRHGQLLIGPNGCALVYRF